MKGSLKEDESEDLKSSLGVNFSRFLDEVNETADKIEAEKTNGLVEKKEMIEEIEKLREEMERLREEM